MVRSLMYLVEMLLTAPCSAEDANENRHLRTWLIVSIGFEFITNYCSEVFVIHPVYHSCLSDSSNNASRSTRKTTFHDCC